MTADPAPLVSVVVCTYERPRLLQTLLASLGAQELGRDTFEVLVVENGARLGSREIAAASADRGLRCRWVHEARPGLSCARNRGWREARAPWVAYTDDDCVAPPGWLATAVRRLREESPDVLGGPYRPRFEQRPPRWFETRYGASGLELASSRGADPKAFCGGNLIVRRSLLELAGGFPEQLGMSAGQIGYAEETLLLRELARERPETSFHWLPELCVEHLVRPEKMRVSWAFRRAFAQGRDLERSTLGCAEQRLAPARLAWSGLRFAAGVAADCVVASTVRDRRRYPFVQNYLYEHTAGYFRGLGRAWARHGSRGRAGAGATRGETDGGRGE